jgi:hypothetical protein
MKFTSRLLACSLLSLAAPTVTFAAAPAAKAAPAAAAAVEKNAKPNNLDAGKTAAAPNAAPTTNAASATPPAAVPETPPTPASGVTLDAYIKDLTSELKLSAAEAKEIEDYYADDSSALNKILNDASLSPLQQTEQVDAMRDARNDKITALLEDTVRRHAFMEMEATYRVALIELAADGGLVPAPGTPAAKPAPATPAPAPAAPAPAPTAALNQLGGVSVAEKPTMIAGIGRDIEGRKLLIGLINRMSAVAYVRPSLSSRLSNIR